MMSLGLGLPWHLSHTLSFSEAGADQRGHGLIRLAAPTRLVRCSQRGQGLRQADRLALARRQAQHVKHHIIRENGPNPCRGRV